MTPDGVLGELLAVADSIRGHALDWFGPFAGMVTTAGQILAAVLALLLLGAGRGLWAPPVPELKNFPPRIAGLLSLVVVVWLYAASKSAESTASFLTAAVWAAGSLILFGCLYLFAYSSLTFTCQATGKTRYVRGLRLHPLARRVLDDDQGPPPLPADRTITGTIRPTSDADYFCKTNREPEFIWTRGSLVLARLLLVVLYAPMAAAVIVLLASAALAVQQVDTKIVDAPTATVVQAPADLLFGFDRSDLRPGADATLQKIADLIRQRWKSGPVMVAGYTDAKGTAAHNLTLSRARAQAVAQWLATQGKLPTTPFDVQGRGSSDPVAPNTFANGADNPEGRQLNRRVVVVVPKSG